MVDLFLQMILCGSECPRVICIHIQLKYTFHRLCIPRSVGILMWNKPFIVKLPSTREEVAILLMDTQGAFDNRSTVKDCATVFALSTMLASVQVCVCVCVCVCVHAYACIICVRADLKL